jgi:hypothetical protein
MKPVKLFLITAMFVTGAASCGVAAPPNVLFIAADEMRPQRGCHLIVDSERTFMDL